MHSEFRVPSILNLGSSSGGVKSASRPAKPLRHCEWPAEWPSSPGLPTWSLYRYSIPTAPLKLVVNKHLADNTPQRKLIENLQLHHHVDCSRDARSPQSYPLLVEDISLGECQRIRH